MVLYLVQHGLCHNTEVDPLRGLSPEGLQTTQRIAGVAKHYTVRVDRIIHSGKERARQTAKVFEEFLHPAQGVVEVAGIAPLDAVQSFASSLDPDAHLMVVGHLPFLQNLVSLLTTGNEYNRVYQFQNSGIACLDAELGEDGELDWYIKWTLNPVIS